MQWDVQKNTREFAFNRTILELKYEDELKYYNKEDTFNRTILELKFALTEADENLQACPLIAPYWN